MAVSLQPLSNIIFSHQMASSISMNVARCVANPFFLGLSYFKRNFILKMAITMHLFVDLIFSETNRNQPLNVVIKVFLQWFTTIKGRPDCFLVCGLWVHYIIVSKDHILFFEDKLSFSHNFTGLLLQFVLDTTYQNPHQLYHHQL